MPEHYKINMHPCMTHFLDLFSKGLDVLALYDNDHIIVEHRAVLPTRIAYFWSDQNGFTNKPSPNFVPLSWYGQAHLKKSFDQMSGAEIILLEKYIDNPRSFR
jgi:hypothetical protein